MPVGDTSPSRPLPHQPVVKDLVPDLTLFYAQYASIEPWLHIRQPDPQKEWLPVAGGPRQAGRPLRVHPVRLLLDLLPQLLVEPDEKYLGPAALLQAYRWITDSRDEATGERLDDLEDPFKLYRCHTIMNCAQVCPKGLNPAKAIAEIKKLMVAPGRKKTASGLIRNLRLAMPMSLPRPGSAL